MVTPALGREMMNHLTSHYPAPGRSVADRVRLLLTQALGTSPVEVAAIARRLRTHPRTLQRRLAAEHTTFETILDDVRRATAARLITQTDLPFTQVTAMVGLAEQSALSDTGVGRPDLDFSLALRGELVVPEEHLLPAHIALLGEPVGQQGGLGRFARPVAAFEGEEEARH